MGFLDDVFFNRDSDFLKSFIAYEEGRGYYIVGKNIEAVIDLLSEHRLLTHNKTPIFYKDDVILNRTLQGNLSNKFWKEFNTKININKEDRILDMNAVSDIVLQNLRPDVQVFQHNTSCGFKEKLYCGKLSPNIKYNYIIFANTYNTMALSHNETRQYWNWLESMLADNGKIYIIGQDLVEPHGNSKTQIMVGQSSLGTYQINYNELASANTKRYSVINGNVLTYFNPLDIINMDIITEKFNYKKLSYSVKSEIYIHIFSKKPVTIDGEARNS